MGQYVLTSSEQKSMNGNPGSTLPQDGVLGDQLVHRKICIKGNYKFSRDGGAVGTITLKDEQGNPITLPAGVIVTDGCVKCKTALTSGGTPTFDIGLAGGAEIVNELALTSVDLADEASAIIPIAATKSTQLTVAAAALFTFKIQTADVTAGELDVWVEGYYRQP